MRYLPWLAGIAALIGLAIFLGRGPTSAPPKEVPPPIAQAPVEATAPSAPTEAPAAPPPAKPAFSEPMMPNLKGASVLIAASFVSALSGKRITVAPNVSGRVDFKPGVIHNQQELLDAFLKTLRDAGYQVAPDGDNYLVSAGPPPPG